MQFEKTAPPDPDFDIGVLVEGKGVPRLQLPRSWEPGKAEDWINVPGRVCPGSVRACEKGQWALIGYPKGLGGGGNLNGAPVFAPFRCGSWRCRRCSPAVGVNDAMRLAETLRSGGTWHFAVLTFDPADWKDPWEAFKRGGYMWNKGLKRFLERTFRQDRKLKIRWMQTWERTAKGWPHVNLMFQCDEITEFGDAAGWKTGTTTSKKGFERETTYCPKLRRIFKEGAKAAGFGKIAWLEVAHTPQRLAEYISKMAMELAYSDQKGQTPIGAPANFNRLRSSNGCLPPRPLKKPSDYAYCLSQGGNPAYYESMPFDLRSRLAKADWKRGASETAADQAARLAVSRAEISLGHVLDFEGAIPLTDLETWLPNLNAHIVKTGSSRRA